MILKLQFYFLAIYNLAVPTATDSKLQLQAYYRVARVAQVESRQIWVPQTNPLLAILLRLICVYHAPGAEHDDWEK